MSRDPTLPPRRRALLVAAGKATECGLAAEPHPPLFLERSVHLDRVVERYEEVREQYVNVHKIGKGLLANHKVTAFYIFIITEMEPANFFHFHDSLSSAYRRSVLTSFMYNIVHGIMQIEKGSVSECLQEDIEYCLMKEHPQNLEWLCLTMHAICRLHGTPTNTRV